MYQNENLQKSLEEQIDVILRLEQDRLILIKENKFQKQKIQELSQILSKYSKNLKYDQYSQTELINLHSSSSQTEDFSLINEFQMDQKTSLVDQAEEFVKNFDHDISRVSSAQNKSKLNKSKQNSSKLNFQKSTGLKEQSLQNKEQLQNQQEQFAQELIRITKENNQLKNMQKTLTNDFKLIAKENNDLQKQIEIKNQTLEKLRKEIYDMSITFNSEKFKSVRMLQSELVECKQQSLQSQEMMQNSMEENQHLQSELLKSKNLIQKLTSEYKLIQENKSKFEKMQLDYQKLQDEKNQLIQEINQKNQELLVNNGILNEQLMDSQKLYDDLEYFKSMALTAKNHTDKALQDCDFYRNEFLKYKQMNHL